MTDTVAAVHNAVQRLFAFVLPDGPDWEPGGLHWPFLESLAAEPHDDVAALVWADFLEESRDLECDRLGELVRIEVAMRPLLLAMVDCDLCAGTGIHAGTETPWVCVSCAGRGSNWERGRTVVGGLPVGRLRANGGCPRWVAVASRRRQLRTADDADHYPDWVVADVLFRAGIPRPFTPPA